MSDRRDDDDSELNQLRALVGKLAERIEELAEEVRVLRSERLRPPDRLPPMLPFRRQRFNRLSSADLTADLWESPLQDMPDRIRGGDHWDLLWRDDPEDRLDPPDPEDFTDPDDDDDDDPDHRGGGAKVPARPPDHPPHDRGGIALPLPPELFEDPWREPAPPIELFSADQE